MGVCNSDNKNKRRIRKSQDKENSSILDKSQNNKKIDDKNEQESNEKNNLSQNQNNSKISKINEEINNNQNQTNEIINDNFNLKDIKEYPDDIENFYKNGNYNLEQKEERNVTYQNGSLYDPNKEKDKINYNINQNGINNSKEKILENNEILKDKDKEKENENGSENDGKKKYTNLPGNENENHNFNNMKGSKIQNNKSVHLSQIILGNEKKIENQNEDNSTPGNYIIPDSTFINDKTKIKDQQNQEIPTTKPKFTLEKSISEIRKKKIIEEKNKEIENEDDDNISNINAIYNKNGNNSQNNDKNNVILNSQKDITPMDNIDINKSRKIYTEINKISQNSQQNKDEDNNMNNNSKRGINNKKYEDFDLNKNYFLACPNCKHILPFIDKVKYDSTKNDFIMSYICPCNDIKLKEAYFIDLLVDYQPDNLCPNHKKELIHFCKDCSIQICEQCREEIHSSHDIENINIISIDNANYLIETAKKEKFKGMEILIKVCKIYFIKFNHKMNNSHNISGNENISVSLGYKFPSINSSNNQKNISNLDEKI